MEPRSFCLEAPPGFGPGVKVLQTSALPLGYGAIKLLYIIKKRATMQLF